MASIVGYQLGEIKSDGETRIVQGEHEFEKFPSFEILTRKGVEIWISTIVSNKSFSDRSFVAFPIYKDDIEKPTFLIDANVRKEFA